MANLVGMTEAAGATATKYALLEDGQRRFLAAIVTRHHHQPFSRRKVCEEIAAFLVKPNENDFEDATGRWNSRTLDRWCDALLEAGLLLEHQARQGAAGQVLMVNPQAIKGIEELRQRAG